MDTEIEKSAKPSLKNLRNKNTIRVCQYAAYMGGDVNNGGLPPGPPPTNTCPTPFHQPQNFYQAIKTVKQDVLF